MTQDRNTYADLWEQLDGKYAERVRVTDAVLVGDEEIVRRWGQIGEGYLSRSITALSLFTDAKNARPQAWVRDPVCGRETYSGVYRVVTVDVDVQKPGLKGIIQTLRKGWAQTAEWSEARLVESEKGPANNVSDAAVAASDNPTRFLKVKFPNCDPEKVEQIASGLAGSSTYTNPVVRGEQYDGTWNTVWAATKLEDDGSGTVTLYLALSQYNIKSYDNWGTEREQDIFYVYDCPKNEAQTIVDAWKAQYPIGASATTNYSRSNGLVDLVLRRKTDTEFEADFGTTSLDCRYIETQVAIFGAHDDEAYPIPLVNNDAGISYSRTARSNGDGSFDIILTKREVRYRNIENLVVEQSGASTTTQRQQLGLTDEEFASMESEDGKIKTQRVEVRDDCSRDVTTNAEEGKEQVSVEITKTNAYTEIRTEKTVQTVKIPPPVQEVGKIKRVRNADSKYPGRFDTMESEREIHPLDEVVEYDVSDDAAHHATATEDIGTPNSGGNVVTLEASNGESVQASVRYDKETDTLDVTRVVTKSKPQTHVTRSSSAGSDEVLTEKTYQDNPLPSPTQEDGTLKQNKSVMSRYPGKYDTAESVRTVKKLEAVARGGGPLVTEETTVTANADTDAAGVGAGADGEIVDASARKNDAGRYDVTVSKKTAVEKTAISASGGGLVSESVVITRNGSMPAPGTGGAGVVTDVSASINEFGKIDSRASVRTAKPASAASTAGGPLVRVDEEVLRNSAAPVSPGPGGIGTITDVSNSVNEFGLHDVRKTTQTAVESTLITSVHGGPMVRVETQERKNSTEQSPGQGAAGTINDLSQGVNQFGKVDWQKTKRTAVQFSTPQLRSGGDAFSTEESRADYNLASATGIAPIPGKVVNASVRGNEFGLADARVSIKSPVRDVAGPHVIHDDGIKRVTRTVHRNVDTVPTVGHDDNGHNISPTKNEFGKYDVVEEQTTMREFQIDIEEPAQGNQAPRFTRTHYGIDRASVLQAKVAAFMTYVTSRSTNHQYRVSSNVTRDGDGFYVLTLDATPKDSSGGGGSATQWEQGLEVDWPEAIKYEDCNTTKAFTMYTSSRASAQAFINRNDGVLVDGGVGGKTGCYHIGRGRYCIIKNIKVK